MLITDPEKIENYYQALLERNSGYVGVFFVCVRTTSVFCISTCRARKPKKENVEFYTSIKDALGNGYRPCKVCKPTLNANQAPEQVEKAMFLVHQNPKEKIKDYILRQHQISPEIVRRWFNANYGMTFQSYQRMFRINNAYQELKIGKNATHAAFDSGYESLSGFNYTFKKLVGDSPQKSLDRNIIWISRLTTPLGPMFMCATETGICLLEFVDRRMLETEFKDLQRLLNATILTGENEHIKQGIEEIIAYFEGRIQQFNVKLHTPGTDFQNKVWDCLQEINYGSTTTYLHQARKMNHPKAVRAVASANGRNRVSIIIPCHRVIGKDGKLTGYGGGIERKKWLIEHEKRISTQVCDLHK
ncbi:methylated-DNA--[protein]-cysteine S-methyltransferase [Algoriphagus sp. D3-2-R+10]|uniref:bifunctional transcriptional activator/DNA repair enzyme AdaA n=1 Tax=Algoriphagus aurantiacus TaxID=3103948 RepID=UPI002B39DE81|nr:methylated-DNA--[protein]-cysteine S-methyltransferase [Algoriphagus sp. D3-2-R+10]MEB2774378.1 methylated-DNA--[protein]-cysteine S-methyltransferase [Algoriphagus sp. D3-2-R+10]